MRTGGVPCSWQATVTPIDSLPGAGAGSWVVDRIQLEIDWMDGTVKHLLGGAIFLVALIFVYRSFYGMRIPVE